MIVVRSTVLSLTLAAVVNTVAAAAPPSHGPAIGLADARRRVGTLAD